MIDSGVSFSAPGIKVHASNLVWNQWKQNRQMKSKDHERFGVLIGSCSQELNEFWIDAITTPFPLDRSSRSSYHLKDQKHQKMVDQAYDSANGEFIYLGTWHTHPETHPTPSSIDFDDWCSCLERNPGRQLLFMIVGTDEISTFCLKNNKYIKLRQMETDQ